MDQAQIPDITWTNPFATHRVRPGAIGYAFPNATSYTYLVAELRANGWWGQIVGPHGTGKTTLLHSLHSTWPHVERKPLTLTLRNQQRFLPRIDWGNIQHDTQYVVDGVEQLLWFERCRLIWQCRRKCCGLLITSHRPIRQIPIIWETRTSVSQFQRLALQQWEAGQAATTSALTNATRERRANLAARRYHETQGDIREAFMLLYDDAEAERRNCLKG